MKFKYICFYFFVVFFLCNCNNKQIKNLEIKRSSNYQVINVDMDGAKMSIADYIDTCYYVPLETTQSALIHEIKKVRSDDELFFVLDSKQDAIFIFNNKGKYLRKISNKGNGPKEYQNLDDFFINKKTKQIEICDSRRRRILVFDYKAKFVAVKKINIELANSFAFNGEQYFFNYEDLHSQNIDCTVFDIRKKEVLYRPIFRPTRGIDKYYSPKVGSPIAMSDNDIYSVFLCNPNIYKLNRDSLEIAFTLDFGIDKNIESIMDEYKGKTDDVLNDILLDYGYPTSLSNFSIANRVIYITLVGNSNRRVLHFYYDMDKNISLSVYGISYTNKCIVNPGVVRGITDGYFISVIDAEKMIYFKNMYADKIRIGEIQDNSGIKKLELSTQGMDRNSNPTLMVFKPKL